MRTIWKYLIESGYRAELNEWEKIFLWFMTICALALAFLRY